MSKPWECIAEAVRVEFKPGVWETSEEAAMIRLVDISGVEATIGIGEGDDDEGTQFFGQTDLREFAEFLNLLADQMDG